MDPIAFLENQNIKTGPSFKEWRIKNNYKTLRAFMDDEKRVQARPIPKNGDMRVSGYTHDGPCEVWLDNKMVAQGDNCHNDFPAKKHCIDYSSCKGTCVLHWYWLAERFVKNKHSWQVYKACVPLTTGGQPVAPPKCNS
ncbi:unnamed protein product [Peronospora farinosa]|uniref:Uncharacterized protein n=1 Tax=Peronospora farinosa TaxID=134698 RepID=A0AAV0UH86_9STRA|nr:unnamed protein product [Peronospora farinosa]